MRTKAWGLALVLMVPQWVQGGGNACTYEEGRLALERGHWIRAEYLLRIAAREGDVRAQALLAAWRGREAATRLAQAARPPAR